MWYLTWHDGLFATAMPRLTNLKPKVAAAFLGIRPSQNRQATRALNTNSAEWKRIRLQVLKRDLYRCQGYPSGKHTETCDGFATEVDHKDGDSSHDTPDGSNYQSLSKQCHSVKTAKEMRL
jgi:5-methylcytosine-specific restriction endonuclease McrA